MANISIEQLASEIANGLEEYSQDVVKGIDVKSEIIVKAAVKKLKKASPKDKGKYAKSWKVKTDKFFGETNKHTIYNDKHYRLTHLLEHGHAKAGGGRVEARPHIGSVESEVIDDFVREVEEVIKNGLG